MKNEHLIPVVVQDLVNKLNQKNINENEKYVTITRLEAIVEYINSVINKVPQRR
jgi:hypothetical protein